MRPIEYLKQLRLDYLYTMRPIEYIKQLRLDYLKEINLFFTENNINMIVFEPVENDLEIKASKFTSNGTLTLIDEFGNDSDINIKEQSVDFIAFILTLIHDRKYDVV